MEHFQNLNLTNRHLVSLFSDYNFLSLSVVENLLSKNCFINIVTEEPERWKTATSGLNSSKFSVIDSRKVEYKHNYGYAVFVGGFIKKDSALNNFNSFFKSQYNPTSKFMAVFPYETANSLNRSVNKIPKNLAVVYVGDLFGPRIDQRSDLFTSRLLNRVFNEGVIETGVGELLYPVFVTDMARVVSKWLFSFGEYGSEAFVASDQVSGNGIWKEVVRLMPNVQIKTTVVEKPRNLPQNIKKFNQDTDLRLSVGESLNWVFGHWQHNLPRPDKKRKESPFKSKFLKGKSSLPKKAAWVIALFLTVPFVFAVISALLTLGAYKTFLGGTHKVSIGLISAARGVNSVAKISSQLLKPMPVLGRPYKEVLFFTTISKTVLDSAVVGMNMADTGTLALTKVLGDEVYDIEGYSESLTVNIEYLKSAVVKTGLDLENGENERLLLASYIKNRVDIAKINKTLTQLEIVVKNLGSLLGAGERRSYLILFQNNMELRPTGGFIGSYGIASFDGGRLTELNVNDIYSADGQLKGHVEPPAPIKDFLGEANWWFRDSNWDPDFPTSAQRAEWFLGKEVDQTVDGVIAIDLSPIEEILIHTGPIFLPDYNLEITSENLYEKTQTEVHDRFFPGSRKKASFLTALSRKLIDDLPKLETKQKTAILRSLFERSEARAIQTYLHDEEVQGAISSLGWDGGVNTPSCGSRCYADYFGLVEANLGVNKVNYFIKRSVNAGISFKDGRITRNVGIAYTNTASPDLGLAGRYKNYLRLIVPKDAQNISVKTVLGENIQPVDFIVRDSKGSKELGMLIEVLQGQSKQIIVSWDSAFDRGSFDKYGLYIRKQAGVGSDPWSLTMSGGDLHLVPGKDLALTNDGDYRYNTNLSKDFTTVVAFK